MTEEEYWEKLEARGLTPEERITALKKVGAKDDDGMVLVMKRLKATPMQAFMMSRKER
jgi:hypothetical protein